MFRVEKTEVPIKDSSGRRHGYVEIHALTSGSTPALVPLLDRRDDPELEPGMAGVQLLEGQEYHYEMVLETVEPHRSVGTDRPEVFRPDPWPRLTGRIRPGLYTGTLPVNVLVDGRRLGGFELEVRAGKLDYLSQYQWMLRDLADTFAEVIMRRFAPAQARFAFRFDGDAPTLYQRFAFLRSIMTGDTFEAAITQILSGPDREWREEEKLRPTGQSIPSGPAVARAIVRSGPRVPWPVRRGAGVLDSLPAKMPVRRSFETYDTLPNRFVKHVLMQWRNTVAHIVDALERGPDSATTKRGMLEAHGVLAQLDEVLAQPLFRQVGPLTQSPAGNQVLQKRAGYRDMYKLYIQSELAAVLSWSGGDDVYRAGQKDVAMLYEYWVFMQLAEVVSSLCRTPLALEELLEAGDDGLDLRLKRGTHRVLKGTVVRRGRTLELELWYNRTFARGERHGSWTNTLRPDCSLCIRVPGYHGGMDELWVHFDAKYRLDSLLEVFTADADEHDMEDDLDADMATDASGPARPVADDLLKMHAYRDAIRRSSGAYVIYPGTEERVLYRYHEILPGLGAFALRPDPDSEAQGLAAIRRFLSAVLDHAATQVSQHERQRYWEREIFSERPRRAPLTLADAASFLTRPPADTRALLGYVRNDGHYEWINRVGLYNMRADQRTGSVGLGSEQLAAEIVVLYGPKLQAVSLWRVVGDPVLLHRERMLELEYPDPRGTLYYCLPVEPVVDDTGWTSDLSYGDALALVREISPDSAYGAPVATTWARLVELRSVVDV